MKITDLTIHRMSATQHKTSGTNWLFVRIETDSGVHGIGEGSLQYKDAALAAELNEFKKFIIGKDPFEIENIWTSLYRRVTWTGGPVTMSAISAIDVALWDIKGKALGVPVYELLGGRYRDSVRLYANGWFEGCETPEQHAEKAKEIVDSGYRALKFYPFKGPQVITPERMHKGIELVEAVREAVGPMVEIGIDIRTRLDMWSVSRVAQMLVPYNIAWIEEPVMFDNVDAICALARTMSVPVATGEQLFNRWEFRPLLEQNAVKIIQPDICHAGGISELKKIATAAETYYVSVAPHNSNGPISTVASLHLDTCIPNCFMQEIFVNFLPRYEAVLTSPLEIVDGYASPPPGPGWGTDINLEALQSFPPNDYVTVESEPYTEF